MNDETTLAPTQDKPKLNLIGSIILATLLVGGHAWLRNMTRPQFVLELSAIIAAVLVSEVIPISWFSLNRSTRLFITFFAGAGYGLAFWAVTDTTMDAVTSTIGVGLMAIILTAIRGRFSRTKQ